MGSNENNFDFIVVGGGTAGCILAHRLATTPSAPSVLLVETGGSANDEQHRMPLQRFLNAFTRPDLDHGYLTVRQSAIDGKQLAYARGKGLGGSSLSNFMVWTRGSAADFERWAELVGSEDWGWDSVKKSFQKIERFSAKVPKDFENWTKPDLNNYGHDGFVAVSLPPVWEKEIVPNFEAMEELGYPLNLDLNSGNPVGFGFSPLTLENGSRSTSASSLLAATKAPNLTVWTNAQASKILFTGKTATGIQLIDGRTATATKEILLTAGSIDTPKLLLLSGVGPAADLQKHNIDVVHDLPGVGQNFQDHVGAFIAEAGTASYSDRMPLLRSVEKQTEAAKQWMESKTGPMANTFATLGLAFTKEAGWEESPEFKALPADVQSYIHDPRVPHAEYCLAPTSVVPDVPETDNFISTGYIVMNPQSRGTVKLSSSNPAEKPLIDPAYLTHAYDKFAAITGLRRAMQFTKTAALGKYKAGPLNSPKSESDEDIWAFWLANVSPIWHANGTVMMGKKEDGMACVDSKMNVYGVEGLRVADLSVCPLTISGHTQSTAYLVGWACGGAVAEKWGL